MVDLRQPLRQNTPDATMTAAMPGSMPAEMLLQPPAVYPGEAPMPAPPGAGSSSAPLPSAAAAPPAASPDGPGASPPQMGMGGPLPPPQKPDVAGMVARAKEKTKPQVLKQRGIAQRIQEIQDARRQPIEDALRSFFSEKTQQGLWGPAWAPLKGLGQGLGQFGGGMLDYLKQHPEEMASGGGVGPAWREAQNYWEQERYPEAAVKGVESVSSGMLDFATAGAGLGSKATAMGKAGLAAGAGMLAGSGARYANIPARNRAVELALKRTPREEILRRTGWMQIPGGEKRFAFEIADADARIKKNIQRRRMPDGSVAPMRLEEVLEHDELFKAYPELRDLNVVTTVDSGPAALATPHAGSNWQYQIRIDGNTFRNNRIEAKKSILHEVQHYIQQIEGWPEGTSIGIEGHKLVTDLDNPRNVFDIQDQVRQFEAATGHRFDALTGDEQSNVLMQAIERAAAFRYRDNAGENMAFAVEHRSNLRADELLSRGFWEDFSVSARQQQVTRGMPDDPPSDVLPAMLKEDPASMVPGPVPPQMLQPPMPELGTRYPEVGPPVTRTNKSGKEFQGKGYSNEENALREHIKEAQASIDAGDYNPHFDVSKRTDVDPKRYPLEGDTLKSRPARPETIAKYEKVARAPEARERILEAFERGKQIPGAADWYFMAQLEKEFIKELGAKEGRKAFRKKFSVPMGATTGGADPRANFRMAMYGNWLDEHGLPYPKASHEIPYPAGGKNVTPNYAQHQKAMEAMGFDWDKNSKRFNFQGAFEGHRKVTIDEQIGKELFGLKEAPSETHSYGIFEEVLREMADEAGVDPRYFQEIIWAGAKAMKDEAKGKAISSGKPMIQFVNEAIERTRRVTGLDPKTIVREGIIKSKIPIYGLAGIVAGKAAYEGQDEGPL